MSAEERDATAAAAPPVEASADSAGDSAGSPDVAPAVAQAVAPASLEESPGESKVETPAAAPAAPHLDPDTTAENLAPVPSVDALPPVPAREAPAQPVTIPTIKAAQSVFSALSGDGSGKSSSSGNNNPFKSLNSDSLSLRETLPLAQPQGLIGTGQSEHGYANDQTAEMPLAPFLMANASLDQSGEVSGWGSLLLRRRSSFFRQVFFWLLGMSLLMSIGSGAIYYSRQLSFIEKDRTQRAHLLLGYLATQSQLGAYAGDRSLLSQPVRRMTNLTSPNAPALRCFRARSSWRAKTPPSRSPCAPATPTVLTAM